MSNYFSIKDSFAKLKEFISNKTLSLVINKEIIKSVVSVTLNIVGISCLVIIIIITSVNESENDEQSSNDHHMLLMFILICVGVARIYLCIPTTFDNHYNRFICDMDNKQRDEIVLKCFRHHFQGRPRTIAELLAEQISINTVAARHSYNSDEEETDDVGSRSEVHPDVWNHAVHARGASFGFNTPFIPNNNDRFFKIQQLKKTTIF